MSQPLSNFLTAADLDFAIAHISHYYDTDFYPRVEEFGAIRFRWGEIRDRILRSDFDELLSATPVIEPWPKPRGGFRMVHQLEPIDALIYTAMAKHVAPGIESRRANPQTACSYRIAVSDSSFFTEGSGFAVYRERCTSLAESFSHVLVLDISDFYNKIYLHRVQNAIQTVSKDKSGISRQIEYFLTALNTKASQGIPVGPAASIVMSEATLIDADEFIYGRSFEHVRYVDDFRIFSNSARELEQLLQEFCLYLHENHRLTLSPEKTRIMESSEFVRKELNNQYQLEKLEILNEIEIVNPYTQEVEDIALEPLENAAELLLDALRRLTQFESVDLGVVRAIVRRARAHNIVDIAPFLIENIRFFAPAANDVVLYLSSVTDEDFIKENQKLLAGLCESTAADLRCVRLWLEWYFSQHIGLLNIPKIRAFALASKRLRPQARASVTLRTQSWVKEKKSQVMHHASWDRRSILLASQTLSSDEREKWLKPLLKGQGLGMLDRYMIEWVLAGCPDAPAPGDIVF